MAYTTLDSTDNFGNTPDVSMFGDSLTELNGGNYTILNWLRNFIKYRQFNNRGIGGQVASQIAARQGGVPIKVSLTGAVFNGLNQVDLTFISSYFLSTAATGAIKTDTGTINNIPVIITRKATGSPATSEPGNYTVRPAFTSTAVIPDNSVYIPDIAANAKTDIQLLWPGRNDVPSLSLIPDYIDACISSIPRPRRVLVLGVLNGLNEIIGTTNYNAIIVNNDILRKRYPSNYVETTPPTTTEIAEIGYTTVGTDLTDIANGTFPTGMRLVSDNIHLNDWGYKLIAWRISKLFKEKNW